MMKIINGTIKVRKEEIWAALLAEKWNASNRFGEKILRDYKKSCKDNLKFMKKTIKEMLSP